MKNARSELTWMPEDGRRAGEQALAFCLSRRSQDSHDRGGSGCDCGDIAAIVCAAVLGERERCAKKLETAAEQIAAGYMTRYLAMSDADKSRIDTLTEAADTIRVGE